MLEALQHSDNSFVTLTYSDEHLPPGGSLNPKDTQDWLKRLRKAWQRPLRYYLVGEYGDLTQRPHYHLAAFGLPVCARGSTRKSKSIRGCCNVCDLISDTWGHGQILSGSLETSSAQYVAGYVTKKMTSKDDPRLQGRHPEFARMSLRPGIGATALHEVASVLMEFGLEDEQGDVPSALRHGGRLLPLGRFMRRRLRELVGRAPGAPGEVEDEEVLALWRRASAEAQGEARTIIFRNLLMDAGDQAVRQMEARRKIREHKRDKL